MKNTHRKQIAGVDFVIQCDHEVILTDSPTDEPFWMNENDPPGDITVSVCIETGDMPDVASLPKVFECDRAWFLYQDGDVRYITARRPGFHEPDWIAAISPECEDVMIRCSGRLFRKTDGNAAMSNPAGYPLDQILLMYILARNRGCLIHAFGTVFRGRGFIFPGVSGDGKTTLCRQFAVSKCGEPLSDDRIAVRDRNGRFTVFGTPWAGEAGIAANQSAPLAGCLFIRRGSANCIEPLGFQDAFERLLTVASIPWYDKTVMPEMLSFCGELLSRIPAYEFRFTPDAGAADAFRHFVSEHYDRM